MINDVDDSMNSTEKHELGMMAPVTFASFGNKTLQGKVDTGATTSSLHASNIKVDTNRNAVSFVCEELSNNVITLALQGSQEVHSADAGGNTRPVVVLDVEVNGVFIEGASFNLNDRSNMDVPVLIGQNILKTGGFVINPNKDEGREVDTEVEASDVSNMREVAIMRAVEMLAENDVTLNEIISYLQLAAINRIK